MLLLWLLAVRLLAVRPSAKVVSMHGNAPA